MIRCLPRRGIHGTDPPVNIFMLVSYDQAGDIAYLEEFEERRPNQLA